MELYLTGLREMFAGQGRFLLAFERYLQIPRLHGNHTHLSVISINEEAANNAREVRNASLFGFVHTLYADIP